jgi:hypothetical protein
MDTKDKKLNRKPDTDSRGVSNALKIRVLRRDGYQCVYCGKSGRDANLEIDHRIPHSKGGDNHISNLMTACQQCNRKKGTKIWDPREGYKPNEVNPRTGGGEMKTSPLDGVYVHVLTEPTPDKKPGDPRGSEEINYQGQVLGVFRDDHIAVQLFSFLDGRPTNVQLFPVEYATNGQMIFYYDDIEMNSAYEGMLERKGLGPKWDRRKFKAKFMGVNKPVSN